MLEELLCIPVILIRRVLPFFATGMIVVTSVLVWAALRGRGSVGALRECWRALLNFVIQVPFRAVVVVAQVYDMFRPRLNSWVIVSCPVVPSLLGLIASIFHGVSLAVAG